VKYLRTNILFPALAMMVAGCSSEVVPSKGARAPTDPAQVAIYQKEPHRYELLGNVEVPVGGEVRWDERGEAVAGFDRLKSQAAARGANGILLVGDNPQMTRVLAGYKGTFYKVPVRYGKPDVAVAKAIYVLDQ
jgi:hypothetical protein